MSNRELEELRERQFAERLATALDITSEQLDELDWDLEELTSEDGGVIYGYNFSVGEGADPVAAEWFKSMHEGRTSIQIGPFYTGK